MNDVNPRPISRAAQNRKRWTLVALMALFLLPVIAAWLWKPDTFRNRGDLIDPPRPLTNVQMVSPDGSTVDLDTFFGRWTYIFFVDDSCADSCRKLSDAIERVRLSQGKNEKRIRLMVVTLNPDSLPSLRQIHIAMPRTIVLAVDASQRVHLLSQFALPADVPTQEVRKIYLVDPLGNLMMSYPARSDPSDLRKDISRLLRASRIG
ncbi:MAG: hypothetical protein CL389_02820 [Acidiferrobacteraceae bacterium]|mgnify:CR=1 FL=1|nr:hypothetical protein [Acidiferrobacteraceae bacterium]MDP6397891.1 SCO family protein [Arenicellales bacterium]MDP6550883.1 SCO family protein [Arenicellales bacterium]MDP6790741.1 SCO family protein [Arenicellales bacterium]MDP6917917.1 SCO family protein [Arenicellales bacterium]|tara:strand:- start:38352 stop:38969 length:618 start_codon:yes stop_codon:yes gene_type:complete